MIEGITNVKGVWSSTYYIQKYQIPRNTAGTLKTAYILFSSTCNRETFDMQQGNKYMTYNIPRHNIISYLQYNNTDDSISGANCGNAHHQ
jgi:hypothetical protein